jgi:hypothetical protein
VKPITISTVCPLVLNGNRKIGKSDNFGWAASGGGTMPQKRQKTVKKARKLICLSRWRSRGGRFRKLNHSRKTLNQRQNG